MAMPGLMFVIAVLIVGTVGAQDTDTTPFTKNYHLGWGNITLIDETEIRLELDEHTGAGFRSNVNYLSGLFRMKLKFSTKKSPGEVISFFLAADGDPPLYKHNELDFEFLVVNNTYILQTNVYNNDQGHREQSFHLWFDPTTDFHDYQILWNQYLIVFFIDSQPIRVYKKPNQAGLKYLIGPMHIEASIWNAGWAGKIDYALGPFSANYRYFQVTACTEDEGSEKCNSPDLSWNQIQDLTPDQRSTMSKLREQYMYYDYCKTIPGPECNSTTFS